MRKRKTLAVAFVSIALIAPTFNAQTSQEKLDSLTRQQKKLQSDISDSTDKIAEYQANLSAINSTIESNQSEIDRLQSKADTEKKKLADQSGNLKSTLKTMQKLKNQNAVYHYMTSGDDQNFFLKYQNLRSLTGGVSQDISDFTKSLNSINSDLDEANYLQSQNEAKQAEANQVLADQQSEESALQDRLSNVDSSVLDVKHQISIEEAEEMQRQAEAEQKAKEAAAKAEAEKEAKAAAEKAEQEAAAKKAAAEEAQAKAEQEAAEQAAADQAAADKAAADQAAAEKAAADKAAADQAAADQAAADQAAADAKAEEEAAEEAANQAEEEQETDTSDDTGSSYIPSGSGNVSSSKNQIMASAGISSSDYQYVDYIVSHESGWNYLISNSVSGAYGLCQALPGTKMASAGSDWATNPVTQMRWCNSYATSRYGSWQVAYTFWITNNWW